MNETAYERELRLQQAERAVLHGHLRAALDGGLLAP
jgi:hypothetical protein